MGVEAVNALVNLIAPKSSSTSSSGSTTTKSNISSEGMNALIQQILGGTQGLGAVAGGQKSAGMYNSTTNQMLLNDLVTRTSGELAKQQAGTTTTQTQTQRTKTPSPLGQLGSVLPLLLAGNTLAKTGVGKKVVGGASSMIGADANAIFESVTGASSVPATSLISANLSADPLGSLIASQGWSPGVAAASSAPNTGTAAIASGADGLAGIGSALAADGSILGAGEVGGMLAAANATADPLGAFIGSLGYDVSGLGAGSAAATAAGLTEAGTAAAGLGELSGILGASSGLAEAGGAVAAASEGIGLGETLLTLAAWVICTELHAQGKLPTELYKASAERALTLSPEIMAGYHFWAIPFTRVLRKSPLLSRLVAPIAISRCEYLLGKKRVWGWLTVVVGEKICELIGARLTAKSDWRVLYG